MESIEEMEDFKKFLSKESKLGQEFPLVLFGIEYEIKERVLTQEEKLIVVSFYMTQGSVLKRYVKILYEIALKVLLTPFSFEDGKLLKEVEKLLEN